MAASTSELEVSVENIWKGFNFQSKLIVQQSENNLTSIEKRCLTILGDFMNNRNLWQNIEVFRKQFKYKYSKEYAFENERRDLAAKGIYTGLGSIVIDPTKDHGSAKEIVDVRSHIAMGVNMNQRLIPNWWNPQEKKVFAEFYALRYRQLDTKGREAFIEHHLKSTFNEKLSDYTHFLANDVLLDCSDLIGSYKVSLQDWLSGRPTINEPFANKFISMKHYYAAIKELAQRGHFDANGKYIYSERDRLVNAIELRDALIRKGYFRSDIRWGPKTKDKFLRVAFGVKVGSHSSSTRRKHHKQFIIWERFPKASEIAID